MFKKIVVDGPYWARHRYNVYIEGQCDARQRTTDRCSVAGVRVLYFRPTGYDVGAFRLAVQLTSDERDIVSSAPPVSFEVPKLPKRTIISDRDYEVGAVVDSVPELRGVLTRDGWFGHCYTNGIDEAQNPTPMTDVVDKVAAEVTVALDTMKRWVGQQ